MSLSGCGTDWLRGGAHAKPNPRATPSVWRVTAADGSPPAPGTLHLLGSIHVGPKHGWILPAGILEIYDASDALVVEVATGDERDEEADDLVLRYALLPTGTTLDQVISPDLYRELRARLKETGQTIMALDQLKPWMVAVSLVTGLLEDHGYIAAGGIDVEFIERAREGKRTIALETTEQQLRMLDGLTRPTQEMMLKETLLQTEGGTKYLEEMMEAWRLGDPVRLERILFRELEARPEFEPFYEATLFSRNRSMQIRLEELLAEGGSYFVVVGAAHFSGERGIPEALRRRGYAVEHLEIESEPTQE